jgi:protein SCO1/2
VTRFVASRTATAGVTVALCIVALILAVIAIAGRRGAPSNAYAGFAGTRLDPPKAATDFTLPGGDGKPAHVLAPGGALEFLFFGYTHCPDECPLAMGALGRAYRELTPAERARTRVVFVTVDPERDTPAVVDRYVKHFDAAFVGLTGSAAQLAPVWKAYGVTVDAKTKEIGHGDAIYAIDASGNVVLIYTPDVPARDLASDAAKMTRS